jgi:xanthine dehydrogenase accessory factor
MKDIIEILERWTGEGATVALGTVVERIGSAPRDPGAALAVSSTGQIAGGVTGGCVEPAVIDIANEVLGGSRGRIREFGLDDPDGFEVGLTCGGKIAVAVYRLAPELVPTIADAVRTDRPIAVTLRLGDEHFGEQGIYTPESLNGDGSTAGVSEAARSLLEIGESAVVETATGEKVFVESYAPRPNMYIFGASDHVSALVPLAKMLGYRVTVCDPRRAFLTRERFPDADELSPRWHAEFLADAPIDARTAICLMTHNVAYDVPTLQIAFASNAGFIGAIGSEKSRAERNEKLRDLGIGDAELARLHAPIGIQIGARTPEEVAVTIAAQLIDANVVARAKRIDSIARATVLS